jgi:hypothetical protein
MSICDQNLLPSREIGLYFESNWIFISAALLFSVATFPITLDKQLDIKQLGITTLHRDPIVDQLEVVLAWKIQGFPN